MWRHILGTMVEFRLVSFEMLKQRYQIRTHIPSCHLPTQAEQNDDRKRSYTAVNVNVYDGKRHTYDRIRPVNHPFGRYRITAVYGRAVNDRILQQYTAKYVPHYGRYSSHTAVKPNVSGRFSPSCIVTNVQQQIHASASNQTHSLATAKVLQNGLSGKAFFRKGL